MKKHRRTISFLPVFAALLLAFSVGLLGCGGSPEAPETDSPAPAAAAPDAPEETQAPAETPAPTEAAPLGQGEPAPTGDGICQSREAFFQLYAWIENMDRTYKETYAAYEVVRDYAGVEAADGESQEAVFEREIGRHTMFWYPPEKDYNMLVTFSGDKENNWRLLQYSISGPNLPGDSIQDPLLQYDYFGAPPSEFAGTQTAELKDGSLTMNLTVTVPDHGWVLQSGSNKLSLHFAMDPSNISGAPVIEISCRSTQEDLDFYLDNYENLTETEGMEIGGIQLSGRTYDYMNRTWRQYYGQLPSGLWVSVAAGDVSFHPQGEAMAILASIQFS